MGDWAPPMSMVVGSLTPGLLLFSAPGKGAKRVPFPAVWYNPILIFPELRSDNISTDGVLSFANLAAFSKAYNVPSAVIE
jgi:hypothetical protein